MDSQRRRKRAFTNPEFVGSLTTLAILSTVLVSLFVNAREQATSTICTSNLQRIGVAWRQYARDYDGHLMRFATSRDGAALPSPTNKTTYWWGSWDKKTLKPSEGLLYPYLKTTQVYTCPAFHAVKGGSQGNLGYGYNADYLSPTTYDADYTVATPIVVSLADVQQPARTVAFADAAQFALKNRDDLRAASYLSPPRDRFPNFHGRHNGLGNVLFCDGHIQTMNPAYRTGNFGFDYSAARFKKQNLGDLDSDGDLTTNELFTLNKQKSR